MRVYTVEECARMSDYYYRLWKRTRSQRLAQVYWRRMEMWETRGIFGFCAHE